MQLSPPFMHSVFQDMCKKKKADQEAIFRCLESVCVCVVSLAQFFDDKEWAAVDTGRLI